LKLPTELEEGCSSLLVSLFKCSMLWDITSHSRWVFGCRLDCHWLKAALYCTDMVVPIVFWTVPMAVVGESHGAVQYPTARMPYGDAVNNKNTTLLCRSSSVRKQFIPWGIKAYDQVFHLQTTRLIHISCRHAHIPLDRPAGCGGCKLSWSP
jgi:hypothetical protein